MKKVAYFAITALLALAVFSCDFAPNGIEPRSVEYTEDGRELVSLTIGKPNISRALTAELAKAGVDFYEVAFVSGATTYRASWDWTQTGRIKIPSGAYATPSAAILFAGRYSDMTLLAVGSITKTTIGTADTTVTASATIGSTTTSVTFTLVPLVTDVKGSATSSFLITAPTTHATATVYAGATPPPFPHAKFGTRDIPIFLIPDTGNTTTASFNLFLGTANAAGTALFGTYSASILVQADSKVKVAGVSSLEYGYSPPVLLDITSSGTKITAPVAAGAVALPSEIELSLIPDASLSALLNNGICKIAIEIPVVAINTNQFPHTWYVRGGLQNGLYDQGAAQQSTGGAILIGVGDITDGLVILTD